MLLEIWRVRRAAAALGLAGVIGLAGCGGGGNSPMPLSDVSNFSANAANRFSTAALPSKDVSGARTVYFKVSANNHPNVGSIQPDVSSTATETSVTMFSTPQDASQSWEEYNLQIDYSDGTSVIGYMYDGNSLIIRNPD